MRAPFPSSPLSWAVLALAAATAGCSSVSDFMSGERVDYKSAAKQTQGLEVPPDLTQLAREGRYQPPAPVVSAAAGTTPVRDGTPAAAPAPGPTVAVTAVGEIKVMRDGEMRWLSVPLPPEQVWPQVKAFWLESGFTLLVDDAQIGVMETDWAENRAKLPQDALRRTLGRMIEGLYDTGERDRFRTRIERTPGGSEIYISHRGLAEEFTDPAMKDKLQWVPRPADPQLEAEFLARLMVRLGSTEATARTVLAAPAAAQPARARLLEGQATAVLEIDEGFDRAWRRVGLALDRTGFTVEDRNRADGMYYVRYVDGTSPEEKGFFARLFGGSSGEAGKAQRYRIVLAGGGTDKTLVAVQTAEGQPVPAAVGQRIAGVLLAELK